MNLFVNAKNPFIFASALKGNKSYVISAYFEWFKKVLKIFEIRLQSRNYVLYLQPLNAS